MDKEQKKIMLVEDDSFIGKIFERHLLTAKYNVFSAKTAEEAHRILKEQSINMVLLDILLPGESGMDFLKSIKADPALKSIPVIILSNFGKQEYVDECMKAGAVDYIIKSNSSIEEIIEKVQSYLK